MSQSRERAFDDEVPTAVMQDELLQKLAERSRGEEATVSFEVSFDEPTAVATRPAEELFAEAAGGVDAAAPSAATDAPAPPQVVEAASPIGAEQAVRAPSRRRASTVVAALLACASLGAWLFYNAPRRRSVTPSAASVAVSLPAAIVLPPPLEAPAAVLAEAPLPPPTAPTPAAAKPAMDARPVTHAHRRAAPPRTR